MAADLPTSSSAEVDSNNGHLVMTIKLQTKEGEKIIEIHDTDDVNSIVTRICQENGLNDVVKSAIAFQITKSLTFK